MIHIVIADDHVLTREGLRSRIEHEAIDMKVTGEAANSGELMNILSKQQPDLIVLDITMPGGKNGLEMLKEIKNRYPKVEVLILSMHPEDRYAVRAFKAGAAGYFTKDVENLSDELLKAIRMIVTQNKKHISSTVANQLAEHMDKSKPSRQHEKLSDREYEVLRMIASGKKIRTIAEELYITIQTVHTYRNRVKDKLQLKTDTELIKYAIQHKLVD